MNMIVRSEVNSVGIKLVLVPAGKHYGAFFDCWLDWDNFGLFTAIYEEGR